MGKEHIYQEIQESKAKSIRIPKDKAPETKEGESGTIAKTGTDKAFKESDFDMPAIKKMLTDYGMPESLLAMLSPADLVENAKSLGLLGDQKPSEE